MKERDRERAEREGFEDALECGARDPTKRPDHITVAYNRGFDRGMAAVRRLVREARRA